MLLLFVPLQTVQEQGIRGLFRGLGAPLATVALFNAVLFATRGQMENLLAHEDGEAVSELQWAVPLHVICLGANAHDMRHRQQRDMRGPSWTEQKLSIALLGVEDRLKKCSLQHAEKASCLQCAAIVAYHLNVA